MKQYLFSFLSASILFAAMQAPAALAVGIDLSNAQLTEKSSTAIKLSNVKFGDLGSPVWAVFQWDEKTNSLNLQTIGNEDSNAGEIPTGAWDLQYDWDCNGGAVSTPLVVNANHTLTTPKEGPPYTGKWSFSQGQVQWVYDQNHNAVYTGKYDGKGKIEGTMVAAGMNGCFKAIFGQNTSLNLNFSSADSVGN